MDNLNSLNKIRTDARTYYHIMTYQNQAFLICIRKCAKWHRKMRDVASKSARSCIREYIKSMLCIQNLGQKMHSKLATFKLTQIVTTRKSLQSRPTHQIQETRLSAYFPPQMSNTSVEESRTYSPRNTSKMEKWSSAQ